MFKYNIQIVSREEAILIDTRYIKDKTIVISINSPNEQEYKFRNNNIVDVCYIHCDDLTEKEFNKAKDYYSKEKREIALFNTDMAKQIKDFVDKYKDIHNIIVHCAMGVSRSGAVGVVLSKYLNNNRDLYLYKTGIILPNETVYKVMCEVFGIKFDIKELEYKKKIVSKVLDDKYGDWFTECGLVLPKE